MPEIEEKLVARPLTDQMLVWMGGLDVLDTKIYPLPGGVQKRTWAPDSRHVNLNKTFGATKDSDKITFYEHIATIEHRRDHSVYIVFQETTDALFARQSDPEKFPTWLMNNPVKQTERQTFIAVVKNKPNAMTETLYQWLTPIEDFFEGLQVDWIYDVMSYYLITRGVVKERFYGKSGT